MAVLLPGWYLDFLVLILPVWCYCCFLREGRSALMAMQILSLCSFWCEISQKPGNFDHGRDNIDVSICYVPSRSRKPIGIRRTNLKKLQSPNQFLFNQSRGGDLNTRLFTASVNMIEWSAEDYWGKGSSQFTWRHFFDSVGLIGQAVFQVCVPGSFLFLLAILQQNWGK